MKGKKLLLSQLVWHAHLGGVLRLLGGKRLIVFNYHRIRPDSTLFSTPFDDEVYGPSILRLQQHLTWLRDNTDMVTENALLSHLSSGRGFSAPSSLVTFDDGYRDNYDLVYPLLRQLGVPAIFFIPTGQITSRQLGWWDMIAYLLKRSDKAAIRFEGAEVSLTDRAAAIRLFLAKMKLEPSERTKDLLPRLSEACDVPLPDPEIQANELMTWDQIREVSNGGVAIGSHTHSHRVLATLSPAAQEEELRSSKQHLERELGRPIHSLSYPVGNYEHFTGETQAIAAKCGYALGFSYNTGVNQESQFAPFDIKRVDPRDEIEMIAAMALLPGLFA